MTAAVTEAKVPAKSDVAIGIKGELISWLFGAGNRKRSEGRKITPPPTPRRPANIPPQNPVRINKIYSVDYSPYASKCK